jgi:luciferase family oxidoreductase group 1
VSGLKLSVVDQAPVSAGMSAADALHETIELARLTDRLGYERYWIAEHHAMPALASTAPEILIARIAAETSGIRVGSGAVLLPYYAPFKVAETFRVLHALHPGRIDLGIGRAPGGAGYEIYALQRVPDPGLGQDFVQQILELRAFLNKDFPPDHHYGTIHLAPDMPGAPALWLLGSSPASAQLAARLGLPYAFAHFIMPEPTRVALEHYRAHVTPSPASGAGQTILALGVLCADTETEALRLFSSARLFRRRIRRGDLRPIAPPEEAMRELGDAPDPARQSGEWPRYIVGAPEQVRVRLTEMASALHVEELMAVTITYDPAARRRSYELLAEAFGIEGRKAVAG